MCIAIDVTIRILSNIMSLYTHLKKKKPLGRKLWALRCVGTAIYTVVFNLQVRFVFFILFTWFADPECVSFRLLLATEI